MNEVKHFDGKVGRSPSALNKGIQMNEVLTINQLANQAKKYGSLTVTLEVDDVLSVMEQLTATTNSLTNAQEALKSAGIEADTVQTGVMELMTRMNQVVADNAKLMSGFSYFMYSDESGFETFKTEAEAIDAANEMIGCCREDAASDGWPEETETIRWGVIRQHAAACDYQRASEENGWIGWCDYKLSPETPATEAYLNAVRAEGVEIYASKIPSGSVVGNMLNLTATEFAAQLRAGNAGKDGSHE